MNEEKASHGFFERIEKFIPQGQYHVERDIAIRDFSQFLSEIELINSGVSLDETGVKERKRAQLPSVIGFVSHACQMVGDEKMLFSAAETPKGSIAYLKLTGTMQANDGYCSRGISSLINDLRAAYANPNIVGVLIEARTGGGDGVAGQMLNAAIDDRNKPVVVLADQELASAGVMGTLAADEIVANGNMTRIGSVGTYVTIDNSFAQFYNRWYTDIYADKSGKKNRAFRDVKEGNLDTLKAQINVYNENFHDLVKSYRTLSGSKAQQDDTLSGEMFSAQEAKKRGLIDSVGGMTYALTRIQGFAAMPNFLQIIKNKN